MEETSDSEYELAHEKFPEEELIDKALENLDFVKYSLPEKSIPSKGDQEETELLQNQSCNDTYYDENELLKVRDEVLSLKNEANIHFNANDCNKAMELYTEAIQLCKHQLNDIRSVLHANRAACHIKNSQFNEAEEDSSSAIELDPLYLKAFLRRAHAREMLDKLTPALEDYRKVLEIDPGQLTAKEAASRLPEQISIQQEKMKEECIGKLKDLGNIVLKPFGLSTDNFKMAQDPTSGGYNIKFSQEK